MLNRPWNDLCTHYGHDPWYFEALLSWAKRLWMGLEDFRWPMYLLTVKDHLVIFYGFLNSHASALKASFAQSWDSDSFCLCWKATWLEFSSKRRKLKILSAWGWLILRCLLHLGNFYEKEWYFDFYRLNSAVAKPRKKKKKKEGYVLCRFRQFPIITQSILGIFSLKASNHIEFNCWKMRHISNTLDTLCVGFVIV